MENLPALLLNEILFRLDRRDMARMRCTNRYLRRHMSEEPYFEKEYKSILLPISNENLSSGDSMLRPRYHILGCCSGLILLIFVGNLFVVNPFTRKYRLVNYTWSRLLAKTFSRGVFEPEERVRVGFTVDEIDSNTQRFKIVCLLEGKEEAKTKYQFEVSAGDSFWILSKTSITCHSSELVKGMGPVYFEQVLYWLRKDGSIVAFNIVTEQAELLQTKIPNSKTLLFATPAADTGLTLLAARDEVISVYALKDTTEWVLVRRIRNEVLSDPKKRMMSWNVAAYDGKFLVLTEATKDVTVIHEYDLRANKWTIIQGLSNCNKEDFFYFRPSSSSVIGVNNLIGMNTLLLKVQPQITHLSSLLKDILPSLPVNLHEGEGIVLFSVNYVNTPLHNYF